MASHIGDIRNKAIPRLQDDVGKLTTVPVSGDVDRAIAAAVEKYSKDRPRERAARVAGTGAFQYRLDGASPVLIGFVDGFSHVTAVAYPHLTTDQQPAWLEADEWSQIRDHNGLWLWFTTAKPLSTEFFLAQYTTPHTLDISSSTVPSSDDEALADLAAAEGHEMLAAFYSKSTDGSIQADTVNHLSKAAEHRSMAKQYRDRYAEKIGSSKDTSRAAFSMIEVDTAFATAAQDDHFFHGKRRF